MPQLASPDIRLEGADAILKRFDKPEENNEQLSSPSPFAKPGPYLTNLSPDDEKKFQVWAQSNKVPWKESPISNYDMRGFFQDKPAMAEREARIKRDPKDNHFPDTYKTPYHAYFSNESRYATGDAPHWEGDHRLIDNSGNVVWTDQPDSSRQAGADAILKRFDNQPGPLSRGISAFYQASPLETLYKLSGVFSHAPARQQQAYEAAKGMVQGVVAEPGRIAEEARQASQAVDPQEAGWHLASAVPFLGTTVADIRRRLDQGDTAGAVGSGAGAASWAAIPYGERGLNLAEPIPTALKGAAKGGYQATTTLTPLKRYGLDVNVYQPLVGFGAGLEAGSRLGYPKTGAALGTVAPIARGAVRGARAALAERKLARTLPPEPSPAPPFQLTSPPDQPSVGPGGIAPSYQEPLFPRGPESLESTSPKRSLPQVTDTPQGPRFRDRGSVKLPTRQEEIMPSPAQVRQEIARDPTLTYTPKTEGGVPIERPYPAFEYPGGPVKPQYAKAARTAKARVLARWLNVGKVSHEDALRMGAEDWLLAAKGAGVNPPSAESVAQALAELKKLQGIE